MSAHRSRTCASVSTCFGSGDWLGADVDAADVRARDRERRGDARVVQHLDQEEPRAALHQLRRRRALLDPHPALGVDVHGHQHPAIEHALERGDRRRFVLIPIASLSACSSAAASGSPRYRSAVSTRRACCARGWRGIRLLGRRVVRAEGRICRQDCARGINGGTGRRVHGAGSITGRARNCAATAQRAGCGVRAASGTRFATSARTWKTGEVACVTCHVRADARTSAGVARSKLEVAVPPAASFHRLVRRWFAEAWKS